MELTRGIEVNPTKQAIVEGVTLVARRLGIQLIAEGIETEAEKDALLDLGIFLQQGFLYARPSTAALPLL
jgi:EAL domain-containing protein (putative c-di-GMP-specific phosphodiesterase class I)